MRKDLDRPHTTRGRPGWGTRGEAGSLGPPGVRLTFLEGAGVKGVEEVGVGRGEPPPAGRRQVLAQRWTARNAAGKLALRPDRRPGLRAFPGRDALPAVPPSGVGGPRYRQRRVALFVVLFLILDLP